jgi:hypothetical protein
MTPRSTRHELLDHVDGPVIRRSRRTARWHPARSKTVPPAEVRWWASRRRTSSPPWSMKVVALWSITRAARTSPPRSGRCRGHAGVSCAGCRRREVAEQPDRPEGVCRPFPAPGPAHSGASRAARRCRTGPVLRTVRGGHAKSATERGPRDAGRRRPHRSSRREAPGEGALQERDRLVQLPRADEPRCLGHASGSVVVHGSALPGNVGPRRRPVGRAVRWCCRAGPPDLSCRARASAQIVREASATLTARGARKAPRTSTDAIVANSGLTRRNVGQPSSRSSIRPLAQCLDIAAAQVLRAERQRPAFHGGRPAVELAPDGRADEVGTVGVGTLVDQQIDLAQVDQPDVDGVFSLFWTSATAHAFYLLAIIHHLRRWYGRDPGSS